MNAVKDISNEEAQTTLDKSINNFCFVALHLVDARFYIAKQLNIKTDNPLQEYESVNNVNEIKTYPKLEDLKSYWINLDLLLVEKINSLDNESLNQEIKSKFPYVGNTLNDTLSFLLQHEALHIGQLSIFRKLLGKDSLSYK